MLFANLLCLWCVADIDSIRANSTASIDHAEALGWQVELVYRDPVAKEVVGWLEIEEQEALPLIAAAYSHW